ncbi:MAG: AIR synthase-related protein, partial [Candidatus Subteraquimicrobiales bacterium]|nr:AIR synthase-related protein [Candidatus Subteraquimicrobiales bacterium]
EIDLRFVPAKSVLREDEILFSESNSRFIVTVSPDKKRAFEDCLKGNVFAEIGRVDKDESFKVFGRDGKVVVEANIHDLKEAWQKPLDW